MSYNSENYREQGGDIVHVGGNVVFDKPLLANQPSATGTAVADIKGALNDLLDALKEAGIMEADAD